MANCRFCDKIISEDAIFCAYCGRKQIREHRKRVRGNGQGTVVKRPNGKWTATVVLGWYTDANGKRRKKTRSKDFATKRDAVAALPELKNAKVKTSKVVTFRELYEKWLPTHQAGKSTMDCYKSAYKHFEDLWFDTIADIDIDDLQECMDNCGHGKRTMENMRALVGLMYKYGIPRQLVPHGLNLAEYLKINTSDSVAHRASFGDEQIEAIRQQIGQTFGADYVYAMIYTGFRPSEFLSITKANYDPKNKMIRAGAKTEAGKNRPVTLSPKVAPLVAACAARAPGEYIFCAMSGKQFALKDFTDVFYKVLEAAHIDNQLVEIGGNVTRHTYTPHTCRHTFSTLMKRVEGADKDKLTLIGHTSTEMLRYYQDTDLKDLRKITDAL